MRLKRSIISLFVCLAICFSILPVNVFAAEVNIIDSVDIVGITLPVAGEKPVEAASLGNGETRCHVSYVVWRDEDEMPLEDDEVFVEGETYVLQVNLQTEKDSNCQFKNPLSVICEGSTSIYENYETIVMSDSTYDDLSLLYISFVALPASECIHEFEEGGEVIVETTCTEKGSMIKTCKKCSAKVKIEIEPLGHIDADEDNKCDRCLYVMTTIESVVIEGVTLPVAGRKPINMASLGNGETHCFITFIQWRRENGSFVYDYEEFVEGVTYTLDINLAIAKGSGYQFSESLISICEGSIRSDIYNIDFNSDTYDDFVSLSIKFVASPAIECDHVYGEWTTVKAPTCTDSGIQTKTCEKCSDRIQEEIPALGHIYGDWTTVNAPTCTDSGMQTRTCGRCSDRIEEVIPALGHLDANSDDKCDRCSVHLSIDSVIIEGITLPVAGQAPIRAASLGNDETRCSINYVLWRHENGDSVKEDEVFVAGETYKLQVNLVTGSGTGFYFSNPLSIICDGSTNILELYSSVVMPDSDCDDLSVIYFSFVATEPVVTQYDVWVDGVRVTSDNMYDVLNDGTVSYDPDTNVLTLDGAQITNASHAGGAIQSTGSLKVNVIGDSLIEINGSIYAHGILTYGNLEITGTGNLYIAVGHEDADGIESYGTVTISGSGNLSITSLCYGIWTEHSSVILTGSGELNIMSRYVGVMLWGDDSKLFLNGTNIKISIKVGVGEKTVFNGDDAISPVVGTSIENYTVEGSPDSNSVTYTLNVEIGVAGFCERLYTCCLGRASEPEGKAYWIESLQNGATGADAAHAFFFCPEFIDGGYSNEEYVTRLYTTFMDRVPSDVELSYWADLITSGAMTRESVFWGFVGSPEWIGICESYGILPGTVPTPTDPVEPDPVEAFATRLYTTCLGRDGEEAGIAYWTAELRNGNATGRAAAHTFFFGDEFVGGNHSDSEFVARLYRTFMGREGSEAEIAYWVSNVEAYGRESVFDGFATSDEFSDLCNAAGINP